MACVPRVADVARTIDENNAAGALQPLFEMGNRHAGSGLRFMGLVHHTDAEREWAYDRTSHIGRLDKALDEALAKGWTVVDMKQDWKTIFPPAAGR